MQLQRLLCDLLGELLRVVSREAPQLRGTVLLEESIAGPIQRPVLR